MASGLTTYVSKLVPANSPGLQARAEATWKHKGRKAGILRHSSWDVLFVGFALMHAVVLLLVPSVWMIALGMWWNANTISHNFIHLPFFRSRAANAFFSAGLSLLLGIPQTLWRDRHLAHHAGAGWRWRPSRALAIEAALVLGMWIVLLALVPAFFLKIYLPGYLLGLALCQLQGHYEHVRGTASYYGWLYNFLFFNDGYHVEHHARPAAHWRRLPGLKTARARKSRWPAVLRWVEWPYLELLERLVLRSTLLQSFVLLRHKRAFAKMLSQLPAIRKVIIVGGGMFPRTALIVKTDPAARIKVIDARAEHIRWARHYVDSGVEFTREFLIPPLSMPAKTRLTC